jgi:hypothetical protein
VIGAELFRHLGRSSTCSAGLLTLSSYLVRSELQESVLQPLSRGSDLPRWQPAHAARGKSSVPLPQLLIRTYSHLLASLRDFSLTVLSLCQQRH